MASQLESPKKLSSAIWAEFERLFNQFDTNGDGKISPTELQFIVRSVGEELSLEDAKAVVDSNDMNRDGLLELTEFIKLVGEKNQGEDDSELKDAFEMYIEKGEEWECITVKSLRRMLSKLGISKDDEECKDMICRFDANGDGVINFDEFKVMMH